MSSAILIIAVATYVIFAAIYWYQQRQLNRLRQAQREARRRRQQREWRQQFNSLSPTIRAAIRMASEANRQSIAVIALLVHNDLQRRAIKNKDKVDWKKEGF